MGKKRCSLSERAKCKCPIVLLKHMDKWTRVQSILEETIEVLNRKRLLVVGGWMVQQILYLSLYFSVAVAINGALFRVWKQSGKPNSWQASFKSHNDIAWIKWVFQFSFMDSWRTFKILGQRKGNKHQDCSRRFLPIATWVSCLLNVFQTNMMKYSVVDILFQGCLDSKQL